MHSKRAQILIQVLDCIDRGDWDHYDGFLVFGKGAFEQLVGWSEDEPDGTSDLLGEFEIKRKNDVGQRIISERTSLSMAPADTTTADIQDLLASLPRETKRLIAENAGIIASEAGRKPTSQAEFEAEALDSALARNAIQVLDESFARVSLLEEVEVPRQRIQNEIYFDEAHKCDLRGLKIATAVLCRAVLESALTQIVDPRLEIKERPDGKGRISLMLDEAKKRGILDESRRLAGEEVRDAGNAIHPNNLRRFYTSYAHRTEEIIDKTRSIILDLYSANPLTR